MKIYRYSTEPEAQKIKALLEAQNIPCKLHSFENWGYDGVFRGQMGMGEVIVPDEFSDKAKEIINKFVEEEVEKPPLEKNVEFKKFKLEQDIDKIRTLIYIIYIIFMIVASFLLFRFKGMLGIIIVILLAVGVVRGMSYLKKDLRKTKEELRN